VKAMEMVKEKEKDLGSAREMGSEMDSVMETG
jgi:hypothetical protein